MRLDPGFHHRAPCARHNSMATALRGQYRRADAAVDGPISEQ
jgi:hypothetical protein